MSLHWARVRLEEGSHRHEDWIVTDADRELFDRELESFVPPMIFDAHAHWYRADHFPPAAYAAARSIRVRPWPVAMLLTTPSTN